jgi:hypothetical protein
MLTGKNRFQLMDCSSIRVNGSCFIIDPNDLWKMQESYAY